MVQLLSITPAEAENLKRKSQTSYWALPLSITAIMCIFRWLFTTDWSLVIYISAGLWIISIGLWTLLDTSPKYMVKVVRRGKIIEAACKGNQSMTKLNLGPQIKITMEEEIVPLPFSSLNCFTVWRANGMVYFRQDERLRAHYKALIGKMALLEYLPQNGKVLSFRLETEDTLN